MYIYLFDFLHHMKFNLCHKLTEQEQHRNFEGALKVLQIQHNKTYENNIFNMLLIVHLESLLTIKVNSFI